MQNETSIRCYLMPVTMAITNKSTHKCWQGCGEKGTLVHCWWEGRLVQPLWKTVWNFLKKLKIKLPLDPVIPLLGILSIPKHQFKRTYAPLCSQQCYLQQPSTGNSQSANQQMNGPKTVVHLHNGIIPEERKKELLPFSTAWLELETVMLSEISQSVKDKYHIISLIRVIQ